MTFFIMALSQGEIQTRYLRNESQRNDNYRMKGRNRKAKVVPVIFFLTEHHAMKAYYGSGGIAPFIL
jgi:hypothetical protein